MYIRNVSDREWQGFRAVKHETVGHVCTMLEESENGGFTLKTHRMFQNAAIIILNLYLRKTRSVKSHNYCDAIVFQKRFVFEMANKRRSFQIPRTPVWRAFSKAEAPFSWRISVDGKPNRRNKAAFSHFSCVVGMPSKSSHKSSLSMFYNVQVKGVTCVHTWWVVRFLHTPVKY